MTVADRLAAALERRDLDALAGLYAEDAVMYHPLMPEGVRGRQAIRDGEEELLATFSGVRVEVRAVLCDDRRCLAEVVVRATNTGPLDLGGEAPLPPTGRPIELPSAWCFDLDATGAVVEERDYFDTGLLLAQLGIAAA